MTPEQVVRDGMAALASHDLHEALTFFTPDAVISGGSLPTAMPASQAIKIMAALMDAMANLKFDIQNVTVQGDKVAVEFIWSGTQTITLSLGIPGMPVVPPTGKKVSVPDKYIFTVRGNKISAMQIDSPANGGIPGALSQLGAMPARR